MSAAEVLQPALTISEGAVARRVGDEMVVLDLDEGVYFTLNSVGTFVWSAIGAGVPLGSLGAAVAAEYEVTHDVAAADAAAFIAEMIRLGLLRR